MAESIAVLLRSLTRLTMRISSGPVANNHHVRQRYSPFVLGYAKDEVRNGRVGLAWKGSRSVCALLVGAQPHKNDRPSYQCFMFREGSFELTIGLKFPHTRHALKCLSNCFIVLII